MKKALKLILIFVGSIGIIVVTILASTRRHIDVEDISFVDKVEIEDTDIIYEAWSEVGAWSKELYIRQKNLLDQRMSIGYYEDSSAYIVSIGKLNNVVCNRLRELLLSEFHSPECSRTRIENNMKGILFLCEEDTMYRNDARVSEVSEIYDLYKEIVRFCNQPFDLAPSVDIDKELWYPSFIECTKRVYAQRDSYCADSLYKEHIKSAEIKMSLSGIENKVEDARKEYYNKLIKAIIKHFEKIEPKTKRYTETNLKKIRSLHARIITTSVNTDTKLLQEYRNEFEKNVKLYNN